MCVSARRPIPFWSPKPELMGCVFGIFCQLLSWMPGQCLFVEATLLAARLSAKGKTTWSPTSLLQAPRPRFTESMARLRREGCKQAGTVPTINADIRLLDSCESSTLEPLYCESPIVFQWFVLLYVCRLSQGSSKDTSQNHLLYKGNGFGWQR